MVEERKTGRKEFTAGWLIWVLYIFMVGLMVAMVAATVVVYQNTREWMETAKRSMEAGGLPQPYISAPSTEYCFFLMICASLSLACLLEATHLKNLREQNQHCYDSWILKNKKEKDKK